MKRWSRKYKKCIDCKSAKRKYHAKGRCDMCYSRFEYKNNPVFKLTQYNATKKWMKNNPEKTKQIARKAMKKFRNKLKKKV